MNKRIKKKNDINRINEKLRWAWTILSRYDYVMKNVLRTAVLIMILGLNQTMQKDVGHI